MDRKDIPNFIGKHVVTKDLKATEWNKQIGLVVGWNEERERFAVKILRGGSVKLFKPYNLIYLPMPQNEKERELTNLIVKKKVVNFEQGMGLFDQLRSNEKYMHTYLKLLWLKYLFKFQGMQDQRYVPKIETVLKNIIEISEF